MPSAPSTDCASFAAARKNASSSGWQGKSETPSSCAPTTHANAWALLAANRYFTTVEKETPDFVALQEAFGERVQFVGIAIDDADPVRDFADTYGVNYPVLLGDVDAVSLSRRLGNRYEGLPFTVVAAPGGRVVLRHAGGLERTRLEPLLRDLLSAG